MERSSFASLPLTAVACLGRSIGAEGGALYALGLIHTNHGHDVRQFMLDSLRATQHEVRICAERGSTNNTACSAEGFS